MKKEGQFTSEAKAAHGEIETEHPVLGTQDTLYVGTLNDVVLARMKSLYGKAANAAQSWGNNHRL